MADRVLRRWHRRITDYLHQIWKQHRKRASAAERLSGAETETSRAARRRTELSALSAGRPRAAPKQTNRGRRKIFVATVHDDGGAGLQRQVELLRDNVTPLTAPNYGALPPGTACLHVAAGGNVAEAMEARPPTAVPPDRVAASGPGVTLAGILAVCERHRTVRALRLSHCDLGQGALRRLRDGARWLTDLGMYEVQGVTDADVEETRAIGWPRIFTIGRARSTGAPARPSYRWRQGEDGGQRHRALRPGRSWRAGKSQRRPSAGRGGWCTHPTPGFR